MAEGLLQDVKVLDLSQDIAGSFCACLLGGYGAEVIKVEPPEGSTLRRVGPFYKDDPHPEKSLLFLVLNLNKMGVTLNLGTKDGKELFLEMARDADVVVESFKPGYMASIGLDYARLAVHNPALIMTSITPFGQDGPYSQYEGAEIVNYAMGAIMSISGTRDKEPLKHGGFQAQYEAGLNGAAATNIALFSQSVSGQGQHVDISVTECVSSTMIANQTMYPFTGGIQGRRDPVGTLFGNPMPCKDGWVIVQPGGRATWDTIVQFFGNDELGQRRFADGAMRADYGEELDSLMVDAISQRHKWELFREASEAGILLGVVQSPEELSNCPQLHARGFYEEIEHPKMGKLKVPASFFRLSLTPYQLRRCAPLLGQHNEAVYCEKLGHTLEEFARFKNMGIV